VNSRPGLQGERLDRPTLPLKANSKTTKEAGIEGDLGWNSAMADVGPGDTGARAIQSKVSKTRVPKGEGAKSGMTKKEMQEKLSAAGIRFNKSATMEVLWGLWSSLTTLKTSSDMGSSINQGVLGVAFASEAFWNRLANWNYIGRLACVCKAFKPLLVNPLAWNSVTALRHHYQPTICEVARVLAVAAGPDLGIRPYAHYELGFAMKKHGSLANMALARVKKTATAATRAANKLKKDREMWRKTRDECLVEGGGQILSPYKDMVKERFAQLGLLEDGSEPPGGGARMDWEARRVHDGRPWRERQFQSVWAGALMPERAAAGSGRPCALYCTSVMKGC